MRESWKGGSRKWASTEFSHPPPRAQQPRGEGEEKGARSCRLPPPVDHERWVAKQSIARPEFRFENPPETSGTLREPLEILEDLRRPPGASEELHRPPKTSRGIRRPQEATNGHREPPETSKESRILREDLRGPPRKEGARGRGTHVVPEDHHLSNRSCGPKEGA